LDTCFQADFSAITAQTQKTASILPLKARFHLAWSTRSAAAGRRKFLDTKKPSISEGFVLGGGVLKVDSPPLGFFVMFHVLDIIGTEGDDGVKVSIDHAN
jgi:hypothetical protein